eukprot:GHUV01009391.1.p1 GENE.GHUV01009391.1~~GHUV01009391.1.p1  ORF type:complete len:278 (+),score=43.03 GHUV01009391.1:691-1524(+)
MHARQCTHNGQRPGNIASGIGCKAVKARSGSAGLFYSSRSLSSRAVSSNGAGPVKQQLRDWHDVDHPRIWQGSEDDALSSRAPLQQLPAPWKMMLLSDGSVTRHLQLLTGQPVTVECLQMELLSGPQLHKPPDKALEIPGPLVQRQVLLWSQATPRVPLVYAASWWASATVDSYLADKNLPIWVSLAKGHMELYREIQQVYYGHNQDLEQHFGCSGPFWGRQYYFWHNGAPLTLIHEVFSNKLDAYLGEAPKQGSEAVHGDQQLLQQLWQVESGDWS